MTHGAIPIGRGELGRTPARPGREVGAEDHAERRIVDHLAAAEVLPVTLDAGVARLDEVLAALDGALEGDGVEVDAFEGIDLRRGFRLGLGVTLGLGGITLGLGVTLRLGVTLGLGLGLGILRLGVRLRCLRVPLGVGLRDGGLRGHIHVSQALLTNLLDLRFGQRKRNRKIDAVRLDVPLHQATRLCRSPSVEAADADEYDPEDDANPLERFLHGHGP